MDETELRYQVLIDTRIHLMKHWEEKVRVEHAVAEFEGRKPKVINPPSIRKVIATAAVFLDFVQPSKEETETSISQEG